MLDQWGTPCLLTGLQATFCNYDGELIIFSLLCLFVLLLPVFVFPCLVASFTSCPCCPAFLCPCVLLFILPPPLNLTFSYKHIPCDMSTLSIILSRFTVIKFDYYFVLLYKFDWSVLYFIFLFLPFEQGFYSVLDITCCKLLIKCIVVKWIIDSLVFLPSSKSTTNRAVL